jgi:hypothetical protein
MSRFRRRADNLTLPMPVGRRRTVAAPSATL